MGLPETLEAIKHKTDDLYAVVLSEDYEVIFRMLPFKKAQQYAQLLALENGESYHNLIFEHIFRYCVEDSWLEQAEDIPAGIVTSVSKLILFFSSFNDNPIDYTQNLINTYRSQSLETSSFMKRVICSTFNGYTFERLDELSFQKIVYLFIQAEQILIERGIIDVEYNFSSPEDKQKSEVDSIHKQIRNDQAAFNSFNNPNLEIQKEQYMQRLREEAKERAEAEERNYRENIKGG